MGNTQTGSQIESKHGWISNWTSLIGICIFLISLLLAIFLMFALNAQQSANIYLSVFTYAVLPLIIFAGLVLFAAGNLWTRLQRQRLGDAHQPQLNLLHEQYRRQLLAALLVGFILFTVSLYGIHETYHFAESTEFCGMVCHQVMSPEYVAHQESPHANIACTACHVGPGAEHLLKSKWRGLYQVYALLQDKYETPIPTPLAELRPAKEICEQCHWPEKFYARSLKEYTYFLPDEENTRVQTTMLLHVGGGSDVHNELINPSIHWHVNPKNQVWYIATDKQRQNIPLVKVIDGDGKETIFLSEEAEQTAEELLANHELRKMDCLDCHNRTMHQFRTPQRVINDAMNDGTVSASLPYIKEQSLALFGAEYTGQQEALATIAAKLTEYYKDEYPDIWAERQTDIQRAIASLQEGYKHNVFVEMKADWRAHPDNIGHTFSAGCFRCHGGLHTAPSGETISRDCDSCHAIVGHAVGGKPLTFSDPQPYQHPEDIAEMWQDTACTDCHTGVGAE